MFFLLIKRCVEFLSALCKYTHSIVGDFLLKIVPKAHGGGQAREMRCVCVLSSSARWIRYEWITLDGLRAIAHRPASLSNIINNEPLVRSFVGCMNANERVSFYDMGGIYQMAARHHRARFTSFIIGPCPKDPLCFTYNTLYYYFVRRTPAIHDSDQFYTEPGNFSASVTLIFMLRINFCVNLIVF